MTETAPTPVIPTNSDVASRVGLTHSGVSRIRSGARLPSIAVMRRIETVYGWNTQKQIESREQGTYAEDFESALVGQYSTTE